MFDLRGREVPPHVIFYFIFGLVKCNREAHPLQELPWPLEQENTG